MKAKTIAAMALLACAASATAQIADVSTPRPLLKGVESHLYNPELSADGSRLLVSNVDFSNLRVYNFNDGVVERVATGRNNAAAARFKGNDISYAQAVRTEGQRLYITVNGKEQAYTPVECTAGYLWARMSPDGSKVVFLAAGKGLVVTDTKGRILAQPGNYETPSWFGNNHLLVQNATHDGHQIQSSQILLLSVDGSESQALTLPESMTMTPTGSLEAGRVVYSTIDGRLYQIDVKLR